MLSELATNLLRAITTGHGSHLFRTVVAEAVNTPVLGDLFYERGPGLTVERLTQISGQRCGERRHQLRRSGRGRAAVSRRGGVAIPLVPAGAIDMEAPTPSEIDRHVEEAVSMFLAKIRGAKVVAGLGLLD